MIRTAGVISLTLCAFAAAPACAEDGVSRQSEGAILLRVIDSACIDIHPNSGCETFTLLQSESDPSTTDLFVMADRRGALEDRTLLVVRNATFLGSMFGGEPSIGQNDAGSVAVSSQQDGIGRHPWYQTLTIAWRDDTFVAAGFTYSSYDRGTGDTFDCHVNFLTGDYVTSTLMAGAAEDGSQDQETYDQGATDPVHIPVVDGIGYLPLPEACQEMSNLYYQ